MKELLTLVFLLALSRPSMAQEDASRLDWGNLKRYAKENESLKAAPQDSRRVVFMGNSITGGWRLNDSSFFAGGRGHSRRHL